MTDFEKQLLSRLDEYMTHVRTIVDFWHQTMKVNAERHKEVMDHMRKRDRVDDR